MQLGRQFGNSMRDGIYKNPSLSKPCQALLKSCILDAERGEIARQKCERLAGQCMQDEIQPHFIIAVRGLAEDSRSLLPGFWAINDQARAGIRVATIPLWKTRYSRMPGAANARGLKVRTCYGWLSSPLSGST